MDVQALTGEEIANFINGEYQKLIQAQANLQVLNAELDRRAKKKEVKETKK